MSSGSLMTPSRNCRIGIGVAVSLILVFSLIFLPSISVGSKSSAYSAEESARKMVLGSRPPGCVNKCMSCQPCEATLVIPHHQKKRFRESAHRADDSYYLLSWKCKCGNKLFQP